MKGEDGFGVCGSVGVGWCWEAQEFGELGKLGERRVRRKGQVREGKCWVNTRGRGANRIAGGRDQGTREIHIGRLWKGVLRCGRGDHRGRQEERGQDARGSLGFGVCVVSSLIPTLVNSCSLETRA